MAKGQNWDKIRRDRKVVNDGYAYLGEVEQGFQRQLANNVNNRDFNKKLYEKGIEFFNVGGKECDIPKELKESHSFITGYKYAERLKKIESMNNGRSR